MLVAPFVQQAIAEFRSGKTLRQIQHETAYVWAGRAIAAQMMGHPADAIEYAHEAIEHAALSGVAGLLDEIREAFRGVHIEVG
jgi:hypothetical protein